MPVVEVFSIVSGLSLGLCTWLLDRRLAPRFASTAGYATEKATSGWGVAAYLVLSLSLATLLLATRYPLSVYLIYVVIVVATLIWIASIDWRWRIIPNLVVYPASLAALLLSPLTKPGPAAQALLNTLLGFVVSGGIFLLFYLLGVLLYRRTDAFGLGDVKLAGFVGIAVGYPGAMAAAVLATFAGAILALGWGLAYRSHKVGFPYGPAIVVGALAALLIAPSPGPR